MLPNKRGKIKFVCFFLNKHHIKVYEGSGGIRLYMGTNDGERLLSRPGQFASREKSPWYP
jgi:hypothetical protein